MNLAKTAVLSEFWQKNGLGPLGVNNVFFLNSFQFKNHLMSISQLSIGRFLNIDSTNK